MTDQILSFGRRLPGYEVPVLNERVVRAAAGILFFFAMVSFMNAWLLGNFSPTRVFVVAFLIDFTIRLFVNPQYAPSMVIGQWLVRRQQPEWTGAPQKRFAWGIGLALALTMLYLVVIKGVVGPINLIVCGLCLFLLLFESAFGICIGCWIYNRFNVEQARLCPGGACEYIPDPRQRLVGGQLLSVGIFATFITFAAPQLAGGGEISSPSSATDAGNVADPREVERCKVPDFAKAMGHEEKWKLHNNCR